MKYTVLNPHIKVFYLTGILLIINGTYVTTTDIVINHRVASGE